MRNIKAVIEYDGTDFSGWQVQRSERTVQQELLAALQELFQEQPRVTAAGRTDAGVHALGQVVTFNTERRLGLKSIRDGLNSFLPRDVRVLSCEEVEPDFHARFSATSRQYRYIIARRQRAVGRSYAWYCKYALDSGVIQECIPYLLGEKVFRAFSKRNPAEKHYLCDVMEARWEELDDEYLFSITANRFLHNMVRILTGTLVDVGRGRLQPSDIGRILESGDRHGAGFTVPARGLFLVSVCYQ